MRRGLVDPVHDGQRIFRAALEALSRPGRLVEMPAPPEVPPPLSPAAAALVLALVDLETPLWLDPPAASDEVRAFLRFHCGALLAAAPDGARFALVTDPAHMPSLDAFDAGSDEEPERSATLLVQVGSLRTGQGAAPAVARHATQVLRGPGIRDVAWLEAAGLPSRFWVELRANHARFPRGVDVLLVAGGFVVGLPRTTSVEEGTVSHATGAVS